MHPYLSNMHKTSIRGFMYFLLGFIVCGTIKAQISCPDSEVSCSCGNQGYNITLKQKQCVIPVGPLERVCGPCPGKVNNDICSNFRNCKKCESYVDVCIECTPDTFGHLCNTDCTSDASSQKWPWFAAIAKWSKDETQTRLICGGAIINEYQIVTSAHCVVDRKSIPENVSKIDVYIGKRCYDFDQDDERVQVKNVKNIHIHPNFDKKSLDFDIAVIEVESPIRFSPNVSPVHLPTLNISQENLRPGNNGITPSWGINTFDKEISTSRSLKEYVIPIVAKETCQKFFKTKNAEVSNNAFCGGFIGEEEPCFGDAGNPLVFKYEKNNAEIWILEGLVSYGLTPCGYQGHYTVYTKVINFVDWIKSFN